MDEIDFEDAAEMLALLEDKHVRVTVLSDGEGALEAGGMVQRVEYLTEHRDSLIVHGDGWSFGVSGRSDVTKIINWTSTGEIRRHLAVVDRAGLEILIRQVADIPVRAEKE